MRQATIKEKDITGQGDIGGNLASFERNIRPQLSPHTVRLYGDCVRVLASFLVDRGMPLDVAAISREHIETFLFDMRERGYAPASVSVYFRSIGRFFKWLLEEGEITVDPMLRIRGPKVVPPPTPFLTEEQLRNLLATVDGADFESRRDAAILRVFIDSGARRHEVANLRWNPKDPEANDVYLDQGYLRVMGKGGRWRIVPVGARTVKALDRYLRLRGRSPYAALPWLWLSFKGRLTDSGLFQMIRRLGQQAGFLLHPHQLRHSFAHHWLSAGGTESDLMQIAGWSDADMLQRYGATGKTERARDAHRRLGLGDRL